MPVRSVFRFRRSDIESVRISRRALSTLAGAAIGVRTGASSGAGIDASAENQVEEGHRMTVILGMLGGMLGSGIGAHTDFLAGPVVYSAH